MEDKELFQRLAQHFKDQRNILHGMNKDLLYELKERIKAKKRYNKLYGNRKNSKKN